jgi:sulfite reductase (ferredoxin)
MTTPPAKPARTQKAQGQWALGYREPLNPNERMKRDDDGLNVRARVENIYQYRGFDSSPGDDLRGRLRWWGLYAAQARN